MIAITDDIQARTDMSIQDRTIQDMRAIFDQESMVMFHLRSSLIMLLRDNISTSTITQKNILRKQDICPSVALILTTSSRCPPAMKDMASPRMAMHRLRNVLKITGIILVLLDLMDKYMHNQSLIAMHSLPKYPISPDQKSTNPTRRLPMPNLSRLNPKNMIGMISTPLGLIQGCIACQYQLVWLER